MSLSYASSISIEKVQIEKVGGGTKLDITALAIRFDYFENINLPTVYAELELVDSGSNIISSLPIQGFEKIDIRIKTVTDKTYDYEFYVYKVSNRFGADRFQMYTLGLISREALINEGIRVPKILKGKPDGIVKTLLQENLKTTKKITVDPSMYNVVFSPGKKTPFAIVESLKMKTVSQDSKNTVSESGGSNPGAAGGSSQISSVDSAEYSKVSGSAGYFFYENKDGYHFKSIDNLNNKTKNPPIKIYTQENNDVGGSPTDKILDIDFQEEVDLLTKLRTGAFSSVICYYNYSTGKYEEYSYSLADSYSKQSHLGSQQGMGYGQKELSKYPTRIMSVLLDHETWYGEKEIASPEKSDGGKDNTAPFPDFHKFYMAQSISRFNSLNNQKAKICVSINPDLKVGSTIEIRIPNQIPSANRMEEPYDSEHSGIYLITELNHAMDPKNKKANTYLTLIRDSYGRPDTASKTKT